MNENGTSALYAALAKAQAAFPAINKGRKATVKTKNGGEYSYAYADLADIIAAVRKPLADNSLCFMQHVSDGHLYTRVYHSSGEFLSGGVPFVVAENLTPQEMGSALSYFRRYSLCAVLGVMAEEDDDGKQAQDAGGGKTRSARPKPEAVGYWPKPEAVTARDPVADPAVMFGLSSEIQRTQGKIGKEQSLALCSRIVGRTIQKANEVTAAEASKLKDYFEVLPDLVIDHLSDPAPALRKQVEALCGTTAGRRWGVEYVITDMNLLNAADLTEPTKTEAMSVDQLTAIHDALMEGAKTK